MAAIISTLFRGLANVAIVTLVVAVTWSLYIYREPIAKTVQPVTNLFQSASDQPARAAATVVTPTPEPVAPPAANNTAQPQPAGNTTAN